VSLAVDSAVPRFYRPRTPETSLFFKVVTGHFDGFEQAYPDLFQARYGFWRPVIRRAVDKFVKCGDLREGFARVRCPDCGHELFVAFSCRQRACCPSCGQKRALMLAERLSGESLAPVPHRQWVFTIPKRLRIYFRYDRRLLGKLCRAAYETVNGAMAFQTGDGMVVPGMVAAIQTFGDIVNWHPHIHALVTEGGFTEGGHFVRIPDIDPAFCLALWQETVFDLLVREEKIGQDVVRNMLSWKHSGFSVDTSVRLEAGDSTGIKRLAEYMARTPFSLARIISVNPDGKVIYRAGKSECLPYPQAGHEELKAGNPRNFQTFKPFDFLAEVTQHIPNKGEHQVRYYGAYSNKKRGLAAKAGTATGEVSATLPALPKRCLMGWAALIRLVYEADPLKCPECGGTMKIISFIEQEDVIRRILTHCSLWKEALVRPPPAASTPEPLAPQTEDGGDDIPDYTVFDDSRYAD
jgi:ribosomal protein S27E